MTLLHRSQFGVVLTAEGAQILPYIKQLSDAAEAVNEQAAKLKGLEIGHVRIGTFSSVSCHVLAPVLKEFKAVYPSISIEIREDDDGVTAMLMRNEIDFGFADAPVPRGFDSILIRRDPFLAVVAENSPLAAMDTIPLSTPSSTSPPSCAMRAARRRPRASSAETRSPPGWSTPAGTTT